MKRKVLHVSGKAFISFILVFALILGCVFAVTPAASATSTETPAISTSELKKGSLFLKANVPADFYDIVCVTLRDKATDKELTLKVEGGTVFEVHIKIPDGDYVVVSAYVENDDQYTVSFDKTEITVSADASPSILLDVQPKPDVEEETSTPEPISSETFSDVVEGSDDTSTSTESDPTGVPEEMVPEETEATATDLSKNEEDAEGEDKSSSSSTGNILLDICLSILAAVVFFAVIALVVFVVRNKMNEE